MDSSDAPICPKHLQQSEFITAPRNLVENVQLRFQHRNGRRIFEQERRVPLVSSPEDAFPGIRHTFCTVQAAVTTSASFANMPLAELIILSTLAAYLQPAQVFEFGTWVGLTTLHLAANSPETARIATIDLPPDHAFRQTDTSDGKFYEKQLGDAPPIGECFAGTGYAPRIEQIFADTTEYDYARFHNAVDLVFVDAGHDYRLVRSDSRNALEMLRPGGVIFWHDYHYTQWGVYTWLNELAGKLPLKNIQNTSLVYYVKESGR
jgi:methyltransferase family protein